MVDSPTSDFNIDFPTLWVALEWITRHCVVPDGFELGEPFELTSWQAWFTANHYRIKPDVPWKPDNPIKGPAFHNRTSMMIAPQKALALDTPIVTPTGWSTMGELKPGDKVFNRFGEPTTVVTKSDIFNDNTYRVSFSDKSSLVACGDHEWIVDEQYVEKRLSTNQMYGKLTDPSGDYRFLIKSADSELLYKLGKRNNSQYITAIERITDVPTQCLTVGDASHSFLAGHQMIPTGNSGKGPLTAALALLEGCGPALFAGWSKKGDTYRCKDYGCFCGWIYSYDEGESKGIPWPTPLIQVTAFSEEQTENIFSCIRPMVQNGPLNGLVKTTEDFLRLPGHGRIDAVSSNAKSRLGQRVTCVIDDEVGIWLPTTSMYKVADTQARGAAGMGGRIIASTNAYDPGENSIAQRLAESQTDDIFVYHPQAPTKLSYANKRERRKIHEYVYAGSPWIDLDAIDASADAIMEHDVAQAARFHGNIITSGGGQAYTIGLWDELAKPAHRPPRKSRIVVGVDGARFEDALAMIATDVKTGHQWVVGIWEVPPYADSDYEHDFDEVDGAMLDLFDEYKVWRVYIDIQRIEQLVERWQGRWGEKTVLPWLTNRPKPMAYAVRQHIEAVSAGDLTQDGDPTFRKHVANAVKQPMNVYDNDHRRMFTIKKDRPHSPNKMDAAVAAVISWEARGDAIAAGLLEAKPQKRLLFT